MRWVIALLITWRTNYEQTSLSRSSLRISYLKTMRTIVDLILARLNHWKEARLHLTLQGCWRCQIRVVKDYANQTHINSKILTQMIDCFSPPGRDLWEAWKWVKRGIAKALTETYRSTLVRETIMVHKTALAKWKHLNLFTHLLLHHTLEGRISYSRKDSIKLHTRSILMSSKRS